MLKFKLGKKEKEKEEEDEKSPDIKLAFGYTYEDYQEANHAHWAGRRQAYAGFCALLLVLSLAYIYHHPRYVRGYFACALSGFFLLILTKYFQAYLDFAWRKNKAYRQHFTIEVTKQSLEITGANGDYDTSMDWGIISGYSETPNLFLLHQRSRAFVIVPKRAFLTDAEVGIVGLNRFREFVARKVAAAMRRKAK